MPIKSSFPSSEVSKIPLNKKVLNLIDEHIKLEPNKIALICAEDATKKITYKELRTQVASVATFLSKRGFGHLDVSCQVLPNSIEYGICYLAALECGGVMSGASAMFTDYELERQFVDSRCSVVFTDDAHIEKVLVATARIPKIKTVICLRETTKPLPAGVIDWDVVVNTAPAPLPAYPFNAEDMCLLPYSSGTTGSPKGVMLSHRNFGTMMQIVIDHYDRSVIPHMLDKGEVWDYRKETFLLALPFYHIYGCGLLHLSLMQGMTGIIMKKFDPVVFLSTIQAYKPKVLNVVPPVIVFLTKTDITNKFDLSSLRFVLSGAAPCGKDLGEEFLNKFKNIRFLLQAYGMTESGMASHLPAILKRDNFITCGAIAANFEEKIIDVATGKEVKQGERGEICVRGPTVMKGYLNRPEATAETIDKDGWLHTGDIGYQGPTGETFIVDRLKELIKVKGLQVPPAELEDLLLSHPNIKDAAVIGIPDPKTGEKPKAFVVRGSDALTAKEVQSFVAEKVSSYKHLAAVEFIPEIPKAPSGKILRRFLRDREAKQTAKL